MKKIKITIVEKAKNYPIIIGQNILKTLVSVIPLDAYSTIVVITDENLQKFWVDTLLASFSHKPKIIIVPSGEKAKNIATVETIWEKLLEYGCDRKSLVINLGGGVIGDMGGFAASTYMRGIDFLQIPTTLLAAVDASVGGKTGIDCIEIKNLIGTFQQPIGVVIDVAVLQTLPARELVSGFAEIIKHGLILDETYFALVTAKKPTEFSQEELIEIIARSCEIKKMIVEHDEKENGQRKLLNFGHTIGHAIEALSWETDTPVLHGEAIYIGLLAETKLSYLAGALSEADAKMIEKKLHATGISVAIKNNSVEKIMQKIAFDKKNANGKVKWVLLKHIGEAVFDQEVDEQIVRKALKFIIQ